MTASLDDLSAATLYYRVGEAPEQRVPCPRFPWEFSVRLTDTTTVVSRRVEVTPGQSVAQSTSTRSTTKE